MNIDLVAEFKERLVRLLGRFGIGLTGFKNLRSLQEQQNQLASLESKILIFQNFCNTNPEIFDWRFFGDVPLLELIKNSKSQLGQDLMVLATNGYKKKGFFVEFGATNGISNSNTFLLEKIFEWQGILCEPAKSWKKDLLINRKVNLDFNCVWISSDEYLEFNETKNRELSTLSKFSGIDLHGDSRTNGKSYMVRTISLNDLLKKYHAPKVIDYLSIDTEGSEYEILKELSFDFYSFNFISVEHNFGPNRDKIFGLLSFHGYRRIYSKLSKFDDWYVHESLSKPKSSI